MNANIEVARVKQTKSLSIKNILKKYNLFFIFLGFILIGSILSDQFLSVQNLLNLLQQSSFVGIVSIGMTFVILVAGIDLSVGAVLALTGMLVSILLGTGMNPILAIVITLIAGAFLGFVNGFVSTKFKVPAFIATLAMMVSARGLALLSTNGEPIYDLPEGFTALGGNVFGKIPFTAIVWIALTIVALVVLKYTTFGRKIYAVGGNEESSRLSGIPVEKYVTWCFVIAGLLAAVAGILMSAWLTVGQPTAGTGLELDVIAAVVIGGTSLMGGKGSIGGTFIGVLIMSMIVNIFNLLGLSSYYQSIFMGLIIVLALIMNQYIINKK
ncbi:MULTISPECIES: ABC transporter permease [unclassified Peribacillus]|uniref:ABC transporter permease n=1 Tax=unclassified Peribacillus TaxID=2675266 RepID=UPI001914D111|nr:MULTISPECIES: ABC transporter permease [unclassified Peribacillus]MBK5446817.1 ABC transporter permease [Peribacillus sp. TH24]MBK5458072.1 ABC transporter permease [Peribacillus sp. TH27]MBK5482699.1 ABC transporter permease [Peribacillus sp. TH16]MBK5502828.1 ABC transporter permease [Peribacillus sp. TH14]WMX58632.1 ABC transporter permease [Peribacillus sp. R9-11]